MSYLTLPTGIADFGKAVISFWFRVPGTTIADAIASFVDPMTSEDEIPPLNGIVPLVVFGSDEIKGYSVTSPATSSNYTLQALYRTDPFIIDGSGNINNLGSHQFHIESQTTAVYQHFEYQLDLSSPVPKEPCYIGIDINTQKNLEWNDETIKPNVLRINLQLADLGEGVGVGYKTTRTGPSLTQGIIGLNTSRSPDLTATVILEPYTSPSPGSAYVIDVTGVSHIDIAWTDRNDVWIESRTEWCVIKPDIEVMPDQWHHVLLSFDLSKKIEATGRQRDLAGASELGKITTDCKIWFAYDDQNIKGPQLLNGTFAADAIEPPGDNDLFTQNASYTAYWTTNVDYTDGPYLNNYNGGSYVQSVYNHGASQPTYSYTSEGIKSLDNPMAIPASPKYVDSVHHVEMAEFQMWTGVTLDTSVEANRRAFIDYIRDANGDPAPDENGNLRLKPVSIARAEELLGKRPTVMLHGSGNWIKGNNTGSSGKTDDGEPIPSGQFIPTAKIKAYKPDPFIVE